MDYEKKYKEALEKARVYWETDNDNTLDIKAKGTMEYLFPELCESEDEKMRKYIKVALMSMEDELKDFYETHRVTQEELLSWLEKQGNSNKEYWRGYREGKKEILDKYSELEKQREQKPTIYHKFRVGDEIKTPKEESLIITKIDDKGYWSEDLFICDFDEESIWDLVEQKPTLTWEDIDELEDIINQVHSENPNGISAENFGMEVIERFMENTPNKKHKPAVWSKKDEGIKNEIIGLFQFSESFAASGITSEDTKGVKTWLKSLKERMKEE